MEREPEGADIPEGIMEHPNPPGFVYERKINMSTYSRHLLFLNFYSLQMKHAVLQLLLGGS